MSRDWECTHCHMFFVHEESVAIHQTWCEEKREKGRKMNAQMEQVWRSKDGQCTGSKEEVEAYLKTRNPLGGMRFPYKLTDAGFIEDANRSVPIGAWGALIAFANLAPLIQEMLTAWDAEVKDMTGNTWRSPAYVTAPWLQAQKLLLAYEEALKQVPQ